MKFLDELDKFLGLEEVKIEASEDFYREAFLDMRSVLKPYHREAENYAITLRRVIAELEVYRASVRPIYKHKK